MKTTSYRSSPHDSGANHQYYKRITVYDRIESCYTHLMAKVINQQSFRDGRVVLYQLSDRPQQKWLCRLKIPNASGYVYRGTGTADLYEARKFADDLYDQMRLKIMSGTIVTGKSFKAVLSEFEEHYPLETKSPHRAKTVIEFMRAYAIPYFSKKKITEITQAEVAKFFDWRRANPKRKPPSSATIVSEMGKLKVFLDWCFHRGHIQSEVVMKKPSVGDNRRPHFNLTEWRKLTRFLREWVKQADGKPGQTKRDRIMLVNYVLILANTGIRVGEARALTWADIDSHTNADGSESIILRVRGKTGARDVVARSNGIKDYFRRIFDLRSEELGKQPNLNEAVFCHPDGKPIHSFKKGFEALIRECGVEFDASGERRVIYSLRHTYATFRLQEGVNHYALAQNMGTSVKMLEGFYGHTTNRSLASELMKTSTKKRKTLPWQIADQSKRKSSQKQKTPTV